MKLLVINGPNLNMLGLREPDIYGRQDYKALEKLIRETCAAEGIEVELFQSNRRHRHQPRGLHAHQRRHSGRAQGRRHPGSGGAHLRCEKPGGLPPDLLCGHGLRQDLYGSRLRGLPPGDFVFEGLFKMRTARSKQTRFDLAVPAYSVFASSAFASSSATKG